VNYVHTLHSQFHALMNLQDVQNSLCVNQYEHLDPASVGLLAITFISRVGLKLRGGQERIAGERVGGANELCAEFSCVMS
jgi:hypothetical protein